MSGPVRLPPSLRMAVRGLLFVARMWASERRFRRHARLRAAHELQATLHGALMEGEVAYRMRLCRRHARGKPGYQVPRTASGVPAVPNGEARPR